MVDVLNLLFHPGALRNKAETTTVPHSEFHMCLPTSDTSNSLSPTDFVQNLTCSEIFPKPRFFYCSYLCLPCFHHLSVQDDASGLPPQPTHAASSY